MLTITIQPNWIYSMCNLEGIAGAVIYDRLNNTAEGTTLLSDFLPKFEEDFFTKGEQRRIMRLLSCRR